jgi:hypothetical protein
VLCPFHGLVRYSDFCDSEASGGGGGTNWILSHLLKDNDNEAKDIDDVGLQGEFFCFYSSNSTPHPPGL